VNHGRTDGRRHGRTTRKHIASAGAYRRRRLKNTLTFVHNKNLCRPVPQYFNDWVTKIIHGATEMLPIEMSSSSCVKKYTVGVSGSLHVCRQQHMEHFSGRLNPFCPADDMPRNCLFLVSYVWVCAFFESLTPEFDL